VTDLGARPEHDVPRRHELVVPAHRFDVGFPTRHGRPWVFAVEDTSVQLTWRSLGPGTVRVRCADTEVTVEADGGPAAVVLPGLPPGRTLTVLVDGEGVDGSGSAASTGTGARRARLPRSYRRFEVTTLAPPPGAELFRFATISDLHIGSTTFGFRSRMVEHPVPAVGHPERAALAALADLAAWGAELVVVKGDLTNRGRGHEWDRVASVLATTDLPIEVLPGNHDHYGDRTDPDPYAALAALGHPVDRRVRSMDVPGLRIVLADVTEPEHGKGRLDLAVDGVFDTLATTELPAFVTMHQHAQRLPVPTFVPPGISSRDANPFLRSVAAIKPATMISTGHTHRHRRRHAGPLVLTEVGSPKDFPGTWAGYVVHEGGIRQVVRRVTHPGIIGWLDHTALAAGGVWGVWSPGLLSHRCFSHSWPPSTATTSPR
jgi:hypothetical protein